jgi:hypothetical protein
VDGVVVVVPEEMVVKSSRTMPSAVVVLLNKTQSQTTTNPNTIRPCVLCVISDGPAVIRSSQSVPALLSRLFGMPDKEKDPTVCAEIKALPD